MFNQGEAVRQWASQQRASDLVEQFLEKEWIAPYVKDMFKIGSEIIS